MPRNRRAKDRMPLALTWRRSSLASHLAMIGLR
jgi:hypothetical protein